MQKKISTHQDEIRELKNQNAQLEAQIRALEKAKATGNFVSASAILEADSLVSGDDLGKRLNCQQKVKKWKISNYSILPCTGFHKYTTE